MQFFIKKVLSYLSFLFIKNKKKVILLPFPDSESGCISVANRLAKDFDFKIFYTINNPKTINKNLLHSKVNILVRKSRADLRFLYHFYTSKYVFFTHGLFVTKVPKSQVVINLWHGLLYKKVGMLLGAKPIFANYTVGTSEITKDMFHQAFGVEKTTITKTGYPRNDFLLEGKKNKQQYLKKLKLSKKYKKIIIWLPTYRKSVIGDLRHDGGDYDNPFYIKNFNVDQFNEILEQNNTLCIVKPHPMAPKFAKNKLPENILMIDDNWITEKGLNLYQFLGTTDILISDVSSVFIDYILLDQPIVCISEDFEEYSKNRGFYFENIEDMIPTKVLRSESEFFENIEKILINNIDYYEAKRKELKHVFFDDYDALSTDRLLNTIFF